jgi:hypothetical protein
MAKIITLEVCGVPDAGAPDVLRRLQRTALAQLRDHGYGGVTVTVIDDDPAAAVAEHRAAAIAIVDEMALRKLETDVDQKVASIAPRLGLATAVAEASI